MVLVRLGEGKVRRIKHTSRSLYYGPDGKPITAQEFLQILIGNLPDLFKDEDELRRIWCRPDTRNKLLEELSEKGFSKTQLQEFQTVIDAKDSDLYDVLAFVAFNSTPVTRNFRAERARIHFNTYDSKQQAFLDFVLRQYVKAGVDELDDEKLPKLLELKYHGVSDAVKELGSTALIRNTFIGFQEHLYEKTVD